MNDWIIKSPTPVECGVLNKSLQFPSRNIYCVGRNYRDHAKEMGGDPEKEKPFFFEETKSLPSSNSLSFVIRVQGKTFVFTSFLLFIIMRELEHIILSGFLFKTAQQSVVISTEAFL